MALKRRVKTAEWIAPEGLEGGRVLTKYIDGKLRAKFEKRQGLTPSIVQEQGGINPDGTPFVKNVMRVELDPEKVLESRIWLLQQVVENVDAKWEDGSDIELGTEFFETLAENETTFNSWYSLATKSGEKRQEAVEKN